MLKVVLVATALVAAWLAFPAAPAPVQSSSSAADMPLAAQGAVSRQLGSDDARYHASRTAGGALALTNPQHDLVGRFDATGVTIRTDAGDVGMRLDGVGHGSAVRPVGTVTPESRGNRVTYHHDALDEWYVNGPNGIEQGFTLAQAPGGTGRLVLRLAVAGSATGTVSSDGDAVTFADGDGRPLMGYRGLVAEDATGRELPAQVEMSGRDLLLTVDDSGATYPVVVDPFIQQAKLTGGSGAKTGYQVAIAGDTIVAGAPTIGEHGAAYVFTKPASGWINATPTATLTPTPEQTLDMFMGSSVSISEDGQTIAAGAPRREDAGGEDRGAVYVFQRPASGWADAHEDAVLTTSDGGFQSFLGSSVAVSGDTIVSGADTYPSDIGPGAAFVYVRPSGGWHDATETAKLSASNGEDLDSFGRTVAIDGSTIAVSSGHGGGDEPFHGDEGRVYVYERPSGGWHDTTEDAELKASDRDYGQGFGLGVSIEGDLIVAPRSQTTGCDTCDRPRNDAGVYVFERPSGGWEDATEDAKLDVPPDTSSIDGLSAPIGSAIEGGTVVVGLPFLDNSRGGIAVYQKPSGGWADGQDPVDVLLASDRQAKDGLGGAYGTLGGAAATEQAVDIDGGVVVGGAPGADGNTGAAYVFAERAQTPPTADAGGPYTTPEGTTVGLSAAASSDAEGDLLTYRWDFDGDGQYDDATGVSPTFTQVRDDAVVQVGVQVTDALGAVDTDTATVTVTNVAPSVGEVSIDPDEVLMDESVTIGADFTDPGVDDTHTCTIDLGDGPQAGMVSAGRCELTTSFGDPGVHSVVVAVTDDDGGTGSSTTSVDVIPACNGLRATVVGTPGDDTLRLGNRAQVVVGLGGDDRIEGGSGADVICGNAGDDVLDGGSFADTILGGDGDDVLRGGSFGDTLLGSSGDDVLLGEAGNDVMDGGSGIDRLLGEAGNDQLDGGADAPDACNGGPGSDTVARCEAS